MWTNMVFLNSARACLNFRLYGSSVSLEFTHEKKTIGGRSLRTAIKVLMLYRK